MKRLKSKAHDRKWLYVENKVQPLSVCLCVVCEKEREKEEETVPGPLGQLHVCERKTKGSYYKNREKRKRIKKNGR